MIYKFFIVREPDIFLIKFILESYENILTVSTVDEAANKIQVTIPPDFIKEAQDILEDLGKRFVMIPVVEDESKSQGNY